MNSKIVISPSNKAAIKFLQSIKDRKLKMQKHFSQPGPLSSLKADFGSAISSEQLSEMESKIDELLESETAESLNDWIKNN